MTAVNTQNTKELREQAAALHAKALAHIAENKDAESGVVAEEHMVTARKMVKDSQNLKSQADMIESGENDTLDDQIQKNTYTTAEFKDLQEDRWSKPISVGYGTLGATIDIDPSKPEAANEAFNEGRSLKNSVTYSREYHNAWLDHVTQPNAKSASQPDILVNNNNGGNFTSICTPIRFSSMVLEYCREMLWMRQLANVITVQESCSLGIIREEKTAPAAAWGPACGEPKACNTPGFSLKTLSPEWMAYCACICRVVLNQRCNVDVESLIARKLARDSAELEEEAFFYGDGKQKPLGIFYDPKNKEDYCGANPNNDLSVDCFGCGVDWRWFLKALMALPECTRNMPGSLAWMFHKNIICEMMLMTDGNGRPLWQNSIDSTQPASFLGIPIRESAYAPSTITAGGYFGVLADFSGYYIADGLDQTTERDDDIKKNEACWVGRRAVDGMIVDPDKFIRLKCDAAPEETAKKAAA